ncbi:MAG: signal peptidase I [Verrucomicrobiales bacterium]|nr:signal peptidase I [Verrucomicrobiales bacterium]
MLFGKNPKATLIRIAVLVTVCWVVFSFVLLPIRVTGISMLPTYPNQSLNLVNRLAYFWHEPQRGDVVSIRLTGLHGLFMKRIIGLPGETVAFVNGRVLINGKILDEPYEKLSCDWNSPPVTLAADEYYFVGDNRSMPQEDHAQGVKKRIYIVGKVLL